MQRRAAHRDNLEIEVVAGHEVAPVVAELCVRNGGNDLAEEGFAGWISGLVKYYVSSGIKYTSE